MGPLPSLAALGPPLPVGTDWAAIALSYLLGAVPFGYLLGRARGVDVRRSGSGNIGATNVGRVLGRPFGIGAFLLDVAKGLVPVRVIAPALAAPGGAGPWLAVLCGGAAVAGHVWPVYLRFRGGKAVSTGCGAVAGLDPFVFVAGAAVWLAVLAATRFVGLSSMAMGASFPLVAWLRGDGAPVVAGAGALALLILLRHRANVTRMIAGTEPRIGRRRTEAAG